MFGVVVCPRCGRAKGVELPKKTTECECGFEIRVTSGAVRFETSDARGLAAAVGRINAELHGGTKDVEAAERPKRRSKNAYARVIAEASRGDRRQRMRVAAEALAREFVLFTAEDWRQVTEALAIPNPRGCLEELVRGNVVYEPKPGFYRTV
jgi:Ser/Thr protein kinase RdoA (MazF antagonist)